ncbi:MAG: hypothetical protein GY716_18660 [bacterium]|nr:hypothetical protein [bacterium]
MKSNLAKSALLAVLCVLIASAGCTNSDPLSSGNGEFMLEVRVVGDSTRFDTANVEFLQVTTRSTDPQVRDLMNPGDDPAESSELGTLGRAIQLDLNDPITDQPAAVPFAPGEYEVTSVVIAQINLVDNDPVEEFDHCSDFVKEYDIPEVAVSLFATSPVVFTVSTNAVTVLTLELNAPALIGAVAGTRPCDVNCDCVSINPPDPDCDCPQANSPALGVMRIFSATYLDFPGA